MARRGDELRNHILKTAKGLFLELGFERASMDEVAARAETSKRSLYAHFASKEKLFLAVIEYIRGMFLEHLKSPADYAAKPVDALVQFCGRYLEILLYQGSIQMCRMSMAEAVRFPEGAAQFFDVMFSEVHARVSGYLLETFELTQRKADDAAQRLLGEILYPRFPRALFGIDAQATSFAGEKLSPGFDLKPIRKAVGELLASLEE